MPFALDYAKTDADRQVMQLVFGWLIMERPVAAPPDTPASRVKALRDGFDRDHAGSAVRRRHQQQSLAFAPMTGAEIAHFVDEVYQTPPAVAKRAAQILGRTEP